MNALVSAAAVAAATPTAIAEAAASPSIGATVIVAELVPPPGGECEIWSGFTLDGAGQRWMFGADRSGELRFAFREDRSSAQYQGSHFWSQQPGPTELREAVREAVLHRTEELGLSRAADPIFAAIERYEQASREFDEAHRLYENVREAADDHEPYNLIAWRNYSHIGGSEIERARDEFLSAPGVDRKKIMREYHDAKRRHAKTYRDQEAWAQRHGAWDLLARMRKSKPELFEARSTLAQCVPTTMLGLSAMLAAAVDKLDGEPIFNDDDEVAFLQSIRMAAAALAVQS
jgi:hypothetical protein